MKRLIQYFINYSIAADVIVVLLLVFGVVSLTRMLATYFPEAPDREINVNLVFPGASPAELEEGVVTKIEDRLKGVTGIEKITSSSKENSGTIRVFVLHGHDADEVLQDVKNAVDGIASFPAGLESPTVYVNENHDLAISFALSGAIDLRGLKKIARDIENEIRAEPGISQIELSGFPEEEIEISVREDRLRAYQLTFTQISDAVRKANLEVTGGTIKDDPLERLIRAQNKAYYASDLQRIFIKATPDGQVVRLEDVAWVRDQWADKPARSFYNGQPAVVVTVRNTSDEDILFITDYIKEYIAGFNATHEAVQAHVINDQSKALRERIDLLINNGLIGFALVLILLALFLNIRLAFWVAIAIPVSFTGMFIVVSIIGVSINVISLFAMIVVIGILVDDGIVISENIYRHYENGMPRMQAAIHGTMEVLPPVLSAILTTIIAFSTFLFIDGRLGDFFSEMAIVVMATLAFSLIEGAFILPAHVAHSKALSRSTKRYRLEHWMDSKLKGFRDRYYSRLLQFCLHNKFLTVSLALALLFTSFGVVGGGFVKTTFFPFIERESIDVDIRLPAGTREHVTEQWLDHIEASSWAVNEALKEEYNDTNGVITAIEKKLGPNTYEGKLNINLLEGEKRTNRSNTIAESIRKKSGPIPGAEKASFGGRSAFGRAFSISLLSDNLEELELVTEKL
ncbi:MAG: efflux RND transporter permease subunit, partial [Bacteroidota bacterium]